MKHVRITIGMQNVAREVNVEVDGGKDSGTGADAVAKQVTDAFEGKTSVLDLTDTKGNRVLVPASAIAYVHLGTDEQRFIGFSA